MIRVSRLNGTEFYLNPDLIETMESTPDTILRLTTDKNLVVKEPVAEVVQRIINYNREIFSIRKRTE